MTMPTGATTFRRTKIGYKRHESNRREERTGTDRAVHGQLNRLVVILEDNSMSLAFTGRDQTQIILYISRLVTEYELSICESLGSRLQDEHCSFFLVTGHPDRLRKLAHRLEEEKDLPIEGEFVTPYKLFDMKLLVPDRVGLIHDVCLVLKDLGVNIKSLQSLSYSDSPEDLDLSCPPSGQTDRLWGYIWIRLEGGRDQLKKMPRLEQLLLEKLRSGYEPGELTPDDPAGWKISLEERRPGGHRPSFTHHWPDGMN